MKRPDFGRYAMSIAGSEEVRAFVPAPLPPIPPLEFIGTVRAALDQALLALGRLDGAAAVLPDAHLLLYCTTAAAEYRQIPLRLECRPRPAGRVVRRLWN
jgi:hypothetical protein